MTDVPCTYPPDHVHESKKRIAMRLGRSCLKALNKLIEREVDPLPVEWCRRRCAWIIVEADLAAWDARQRVSTAEAREMGLVRKRHSAA